MRTVSSAVTAVLLSGCALLLAACGNDASADPTTSTLDESAVTVTTRHVVLTEPTAAPQTTVDPQMIENCVTYIPFAAEQQGLFYMAAIWNEVGKDLGRLREFCEGLVTSDPAALKQVSDAQEALDAFFQSFTSTTVVGAPPPATAAACPEGTRLNEQGFCVTTP